MKVILIKDVPKIGKINDVIEVNDGYGKNYLIKNNLAEIYNSSSIHKLNERLKNDQKIEEEKIASAKLLKNSLEGLNLEFEIKSNNGRTFGHITNKSIMDEINKLEKLVNKYMFEQSYKLDTGNYQIKLNLYKDVFALVNVKVKEVK